MEAVYGSPEDVGTGREWVNPYDEAERRCAIRAGIPGERWDAMQAAKALAEEDRANGAALRALVASGLPLLVGYDAGLLPWAVRDTEGELVARRGTLPEAVAAALGEPTEV